MFTLKDLLITIVVFTYTTSHAIAQSFYDKIEYCENHNLIDSAYSVIKTYETKFQNNSQWDSLIYLYGQEYIITRRYKGVSDLEKIIKKTENIATQYFKITDKAYHKMLLLKTDFYDETREFKKLKTNLDLLFSQKENLTDTYFNDLISNYSLYLMRQSDTENAIAFMKENLDRVVATKDTSCIYRLYYYLTAGNHWTLNYSAAKEYAFKNVEIVEKHFGKTHPNAGIIYGQIAGLYLDMGESQKAINYEKKNRKVQYQEFKNTKNPSQLAGAIEDQAYMYSKLGEYHLAIDNMLYALRLYRESVPENSPKLLWHYSQMVTYYRLAQQYNNAMLYLIKVKKIIDTNKDLPVWETFSYEAKLAELNFHLDNNNLALNQAKDVLKKFELNPDIGDPKDRMMLYNLITNILIDEEKWDEANSWSTKSIKLHKEKLHRFNDLVISAMVPRLDILVNQNNIDSIYEWKNEILNIRNIDSTDTSLSSSLPSHDYLVFASKWVSFLTSQAKKNPTIKSEYFKFLKEFEEYYEIHLASLKTNAAVATNETLLKEIYGPSITWSLDKDYLRVLNYIEKFKALSHRQRLQYKLIDDKSLPSLSSKYSSILNNEDDIQLAEEIAIALDSFTTYKATLKRDNPTEYEKYFGLENLTKKHIDIILQDDEMLINCLLLDSVYIVYYVTQKEQSVNIIPSRRVDSLLTDYTESKSPEIAQELKTLLLPKDNIGSFKNFLVIPDGNLNSLSFEQLIEKDKPLIYQYTFRYGHSIFVLKHQQNLGTTKSKNDLLGLTPGFTQRMKDKINISEGDSSLLNYLRQPFMLSLAEALDHELQGDTYTYENATESNFKSSSFDVKILHLGTHGVLNENSPLSSKLILVNDSLQDGNLHAFEIFGENIDADLAVLSACSSGKDQNYAYQGIVSLSRAFTHAGCPSVLMTLWEVDEKSTAAILSSFYKNLQKGQRKSVALRNAKLSFLENSTYQYQDPYYWAGLVLIGNDDPLFSSYNFNHIALLTLCLLIVAFSIWWISKKKG